MKFIILFIIVFLFQKSFLMTQESHFKKEIIQTDKAPKPIGPYSQAVVAGNLVFLSGQIAIDSATNEIIKGTITDETKMVMKNIESVLAAAGLNMNNIIKTTIYLTDIKDFKEVNAVYGSFFIGKYPARETVQVAALPKGAKVEISVIAIKE